METSRLSKDSEFHKKTNYYVRARRCWVLVHRTTKNMLELTVHIHTWDNATVRVGQEALALNSNCLPQNYMFSSCHMISRRQNLLILPGSDDGCMEWWDATSEFRSNYWEIVSCLSGIWTWAARKKGKYTCDRTNTTEDKGEGEKETIPLCAGLRHKSIMM